MSTTVKYKGNTLTTVSNATKTLKTAGKYMEGDVILVDVTESGSGSGVVWQDSQGYVHLSDEGTPPISVEALSVTQNGTYTAPTGKAYSPVTVNVSGGGGLVYETGTWTPSADVSSYVIPFANTHTTAPFRYMIADATGTNISTTNTNYAVFYQNYHQVFGESNCAEGGTAEYGYVMTRYLPSGTVLSGASTALNEPFTSSASSANTKPRFWATETGIKAYTNSASRYWRAGRTYKWIAAWTPTT